VVRERSEWLVEALREGSLAMRGKREKVVGRACWFVVAKEGWERCGLMVTSCKMDLRLFYSSLRRIRSILLIDYGRLT
jgi:hypothetical protein